MSKLTLSADPTSWQGADFADKARVPLTVQERHTRELASRHPVELLGKSGAAGVD